MLRRLHFPNLHSVSPRFAFTSANTTLSCSSLFHHQHHVQPNLHSTFRFCQTKTTPNQQNQQKQEEVEEELLSKELIADLLVKNSGSVARDQLALERTFLAFFRTALSFFGAAIALWTSYCFNFDESNENSVHPSEIFPSCLLLFGNGFILTMYALKRYLHVQTAMQGGEFIIARRRFILIVLVTMAITIGALYHVYSLEMERKQHRKKRKTTQERSESES